MPAGAQRPEEIHRLLEDAKVPVGGGMLSRVLANPQDDAYDQSIENAIREDIQAYGTTSGSATLQQFIKAHSRTHSMQTSI